MERVLARPIDRLGAVRAYKEGNLGISWGPTPGDGFFLRWRDWANANGWSLPLFGGKKAFIAKLLENDETFELVLIRGLDIYIPQEYRSL